MPGSPERRCTTTLTNCDVKMVGNREDAEAQNRLQKFVKTQRHRLQRHKPRQPRLRRPRLETRCNNSSSNPRWWKTRQNSQIFSSNVLGSSTISTCRILNICFDFLKLHLPVENNNKKLTFKIQYFQIDELPRSRQFDFQLTQKLVKWQCLCFVMQWFDKIFHLQTLVYIKFHSDFLTRFSPSFSRQVQRRRPLSRPVAPLTIRRRRLRRLPPPQPRRTSRLQQILWALLPKPCWPKCKQKCNYVLISKIAFACNKKLLGNILSWNQIIYGLAFTLLGMVYGVKSRGPILHVTSSETCSVCVKQALNTPHWLVNAPITWHVSYKQ